MADHERQGVLPGKLYQEHLMLDARFGEGFNGVLVPDSYGYGSGEAEGTADAFEEGAALADLSGLYTLLVHGDPAPLFTQTAFAGIKLGVGSCAFEAVLAGDGSLTAVPLLARTGQHEYAVWDATPRSGALDAWLGFLAQVSQGGVTPFAGLSCEDVAQKVVPLVLWGRAAQRVLLDYLPKGTPVPVAGEVASLSLDGRIDVLVASIALDGLPCYLMMVPSNQAQVLWRSFLSFNEVAPVGMSALRAHAINAQPWVGQLLQEGERLSFTAQELEEHGLVRAERDFVGARGLNKGTLP